MTLFLMMAALGLLLLLRVPVAIALVTPALAYVLVDGTASVGLAVQQTLSGVNNFPILAVPMFILLGNLANISGVTHRVFNAALAGLVLFVLSSVTSTPVPQVIRGILPFFVPMLVVLLVVTFVPALSVWLPTVLGFA